MKEQRKRILLIAALVAVAVLLVRGFFDSASFYENYKIVYGLTLFSIHSSELVFYSWFLFFGLLTTLALTGALYKTPAPAAVERLVGRMFSKPCVFVLLLCASVFVFVAAFRFVVLMDAPIADDESTYSFIAKTLLHGRLVNPHPKDASFFTNQFVVINEQGWFGKYPIGHPLLLAVGEFFGVAYLVGPLLCALTLLFTYKIGEKLYGEKTALIGVCLTALSPHLLWTFATMLSQTSSTLFLVAGIWAYLCFAETKRARWGILTGFLFAYGVIVRPLPGALFLIAAGMVALFQSGALPFFTRLKSNLRLLVPMAIFAAASLAFLLAVNHFQTGDAAKTGYHAVHGADMGIGLGQPSVDGRAAQSVASSLLRQNFWTLGWPLSLIFVFFAARGRGFSLFIAVIAAEYLYRVLVPKTVVATTGPIYVTEIVPLLTVMTASGLIEVKRRLEQVGFVEAKSAVISFVVASTAAAFLLFWPVEIAAVHNSVVRWRAPITTLEAKGIKKALVFANMFVETEAGISWAGCPPNPSPTLDDDIIFVRVPKDDDPVPAMREFHRRRFPDRPAFVLHFQKAEATLLSLE